MRAAGGQIRCCAAETADVSTVWTAAGHGLLAGWAIALPVGAIGTYVVALTSRTSLRVGASAALGVASADGIYALVAAFAGTAVAAVVAPVERALVWVAAGVLLALAVRSLLGLRSSGPAPVAVVRPAHAYLRLLGLTLVNPATVVYFAAVVVGSGPVRGVVPAVVFAVAAFCASASWQLVLAGGGTVLGSVVSGARGRAVTTVVSSAVIVALAVDLLVARG